MTFPMLFEPLEAHKSKKSKEGVTGARLRLAGHATVSLYHPAGNYRHFCAAHQLLVYQQC